MGHPPSAFGVTQLGVVHIPDKFSKWTGGSAEELADIANQVLSETEVPDADLNERLVRHYVTMGVIDPAVRRGRDAIFSLRHLVQLMVVRKLLAERLSLSQIRDLFRTIDWNQADAVAELLPKPVSATGPGRLLAQFRGESSPVQHLLKSKRQQWESNQATHDDAERLLRWKLNRWCEVLADASAVENLTDEQVAQVAHEFTAALMHFRDQYQQGQPEMNNGQVTAAIVREEAQEDGVKTCIARLRERYRPDKVHVLFVAESPPESSDDEPRFFYNPNREHWDNLYRSMMKAVFPEFEYRPGEKDNWLRRFQKDGYYLIDATDRPINRLSAAERRLELNRAVEEKVAEITHLVTPSTPIVLVKKSVFEALNRPLREVGYNVIHESFLPFPAQGHQERFIEACSMCLRKVKRSR